jgi:hypothetical protein
MAIALALVAPITGPASAQDKGAADSVSLFGEKELKLPENWKRTRPQSPIIEHEFAIKSGEAADVKANIDRWKGQFTGGNAEAQKVEELKVGDWTVHMVDLSGKFKESMGGGPFAPGKVVERENYAMIGGILVDPKGRKYFIKMTGPAELVKSNREGVLKMIEGLK